jgi:RNA polymerase sigma factor (TIGR02999 family)
MRTKANLAASLPVTKLLQEWGDGDETALQQLIPIVEKELHRLARRAMAGEPKDHTLQPTALVNEVFLRFVDLRQVKWQDRAHFFALTARLMRRILVDLVRSKRCTKRGGGAQTISLSKSFVATEMRIEDLIALDDALRKLARLDPRRSQVVELRFFGGLSISETAEVLKISVMTVNRDWDLARTWLWRELKGKPREQH